MGVPRLHRFIAERFPYAIRAVTRQSHRGHVDYLYIDFNGLIHESINRASYAPLDRPEIDVFNQTFSYLKMLVSLLYPQMVYIAIDGAAPNAKIRYQRQRRIFGAIESDSRKEFRHRISGYGDIFQQQDTLSSPGITPGTQFMNRLTSFLLGKIVDSIENGEFDCYVEISDSSNPGEGEHKIVYQIRDLYKDFDYYYPECKESNYTLLEAYKYRKAWKLSETHGNYDVIQITELGDENYEIDEENYELEKEAMKGTVYPGKHVPRVGVFGMDGDLILLMLGLNKPEITLFKRFPGLFVTEIESVSESKTDPWNNGLIAMDINQIREGIIYELLYEHFETKEKLLQLVKKCSNEGFINEFVLPHNKQLNTVVRMPNQYLYLLRERIVHSALADRIIHDFIALALFVGNDFLPEVPGQSIKNGALDELMKLYRRENISEMPFKFLLDEKHQIDLKQISYMFRLIGENVEFIQVVRDMQDFITLQQYVQRLSDDFKCDIVKEYEELRYDLGIDIISYLQRERPQKLCNDRILRAQVMQFYRKKYYKKFDYLKLRYQIVCPMNLSYMQIRELAVMDKIENLRETSYAILPEMQEFSEQNLTCNVYRGLHHLVRTYLKTMQWVLDYYLNANGLVQWGWEFSYPFTPLCSDMAVYCELFNLDVASWNAEYRARKNDDKQFDKAIKKQQYRGAEKPTAESKEFVVEFEETSYSFESNVSYDTISYMDNDELKLLTFLKEYDGPRFVFIKDKPHDALTQLAFTLPASYQNLLPEFVLRHIDPAFFKEQPSYNTVLVAHYESAFYSLNQRMDLSRPNMEFLSRRPSYASGFGWNPNFTCFYKHYPLGLTDGVNFEEVERMLKQVDKNCYYYQNYYRQLGSLLIMGHIRTMTPQYGKLSTFHLLCAPNSVSYPNEYKFNLDPKAQYFYQFVSHYINKSFIYSEFAPESISSLLYFHYSAASALSKLPIVRQAAISYAYNLHLLSETALYLNLYNIKMNVITESVGANVCVATPALECDSYVSNDCELAKYANPQGLNRQIDAFMSVAKAYKSQKLEQSILPDQLLAEYENRVYQSLLDNSLVSFESSYYGVAIGSWYKENLFIREIDDSILGTFRNKTTFLRDLMEELKLSGTPQALLYSLIYKYYKLNKGRYFKDDQQLIFVLKCGFEVSRLSLKRVLSDILLAPSKWPRINYNYLAFFDTLPVVPVPLELLHRKFYRISFLRTVVTDFAHVCLDPVQLEDVIFSQQRKTFLGDKTVLWERFSREQAQGLAKRLFNRFGNVVPKRALYSELDRLEAAYREQVRIVLPSALEITEYNIPGLKYSLLTPNLRDFDLSLPQNVLSALLSDLTIECADLASRELGLTVLTSRLYDPNFVLDGRPTLRCVLALFVAKKAFPRLYDQIAKSEALFRGRLRTNGLQTGNGREEFQAGTKKLRPPEFNFNRLPVYDSVPFSQMQLASVISAASLLVHRFLVPVNRQMLIPREFTSAYCADVVDYVARQLSRVVFERFDESAKGIESTTKVRQTTYVYRPISTAQLGDFLFSPIHGVVIVVAVANDRFRAVSDRHLFSLNSTLHWNAIEAEFGEEYYLLERGLVRLQTKFSYAFAKTRCTGLKIDLAKEPDEWLVDIVASQPKKEEFDIEFE